ncbi:uncharacterized protein LOC133146297 isoform X2 [Syngnathus typhle]|uniref:uncharacterized protein LOC133146133 n=1 Tax=Syngnathus typhle TaxID=161592 RepID=UPI002A6A5284|nr:uncharacterized protein LOC133146133 [Syngnathus typhle]XP_061125812.1 uncharacterized protein LOC133146297 isoform X2 [Syngnathus typhle]
MDTFRLCFRLLLLLLLLPPVAPDDCPECEGADDPKDCKCNIGGNLKMKASLTTTDKWTDQDNDVISEGGRFTISGDKKSLTLNSVEVGDANKVYTATKTDDSKTQKFKVIPLVVCEDDKEPCKVDLGQNVRLKAGNSAYSWFLGTEAKTTVNGNLDITSVSAADSGKYQAKDGKDVKKTIPFNMPTIPKPVADDSQQTPADSNPRGKSGRQLAVKASSDGPAKVGAQWSLECVVTQNDTRVTHFTWWKDDKVMVGQTGAKVVFEALKAMDAAKYRCKAGDDESLNYDLTVVGSGAVAPSSSLLLTLSLLLGLLCC